MAEATDTKGIIYQNLKDAGCDDVLTEKCMTFLDSGDTGNMLPLLKKHKQDLLSKVRKQQQQIDCLDYLIYKLQKEISFVK